MGIKKVTLTIKHPSDPKRRMEAEFLVDSGAHYTVLPQRLVHALAIQPSYSQKFSLADGRTVTRKIGSAFVEFQGQELAVPVVLGEKDDDALLGVTTLESFGLMLDPFKREIYPSKLMLA